MNSILWLVAFGVVVQCGIAVAIMRIAYTMGRDLKSPVVNITRVVQPRAEGMTIAQAGERAMRQMQQHPSIRRT